MWHEQRHPNGDRPQGSSASLAQNASGPAPRPENFLTRPYERRTAPSKREKDMDRLEFRLERQRLFKDAFHDNIDSKGEVDALTRSEALTVDRGDVLRDPKVKGYRHPALAVKWDPKAPRQKVA